MRRLQFAMKFIAKFAAADMQCRLNTIMFSNTAPDAGRSVTAQCKMQTRMAPCRLHQAINNNMARFSILVDCSLNKVDCVKAVCLYSLTINDMPQILRRYDGVVSVYEY